MKEVTDPSVLEQLNGSSYETKLNPTEEKTFQAWKGSYAPNDSGMDYDLRGAFKAGLKPGVNGHWPDTFKKPNHPTFSDQSIYAKDRPELAGTWNGETYVPPMGNSTRPLGKPVTNPLILAQLNQSEEPGVMGMVRRGMETVGKYLKPTMDKTPGLLPTEPATTLGQELFNKMGEKSAETLAGPGYKSPLDISGSKPQKLNPIAAAGVGFATQSIPDLLSLGTPVPPAESDVLTLSKEAYPLKETAVNNAVRAIGGTKRFLNTAPKVDRIREAAEILLDQGAITATNGGEAIAAATKKLENLHGQKIGAYLQRLDKEGSGIDPQKLIDGIEELRPPQKTGHFKQIQNQLDLAVDTIKAYATKTKKLVMEPGGLLKMNDVTELPPIPWDQANKVKGMLQDQAFGKTGNVLDRVIAGRYRETLDNELERLSNEIGDPAAHQDFLRSKKIYGATQTAKDPIYNRISSDLGNRQMGLLDWIVAAPEIATGDPLTAVALVAGRKGLKRFGPSSLAVGAYNTGKALRRVVPKASSAILHSMANP